MTELDKIMIARQRLSISGLASELIALGEFKQRNLKICEKYIIASNKWTTLPCLNTPRQSAGSILLPSVKAFCFCGSQGVRE